MRMRSEWHAPDATRSRHEPGSGRDVNGRRPRHESGIGRDVNRRFPDSYRKTHSIRNRLSAGALAFRIEVAMRTESGILLP